MSDNIGDMLKSWDLEVLVQRFEDNCIDMSTMEALTHTLIKELIPEIGLRLKFEKRWKNFVMVGGSLTSENSHEGSVQSFTDNENLLSDESDIENKNTLQNVEEISSSKKETAKRGTKIPHVKNILKNCESGRLIIKYYEKHKILSRQIRNNLVDLIVTHLMDSTDRKINKNDFYYLAKEIIEIFPNEDIDLYYVPSISKHDSKLCKSVSVRGKLSDKYRNKIQMYKRLSSDFKSLKKPNSSSNETSPINEIKESILWLEKNQAPWETVLSHWKATRQHRLNQWKNNNEKHIFKIIEKWSILNHPMGFTLIEEDFQFLNLTNEIISAESFNTFFNRLLQICPLDKKKNERVQIFRDLLEKDVTEDTKVAVQLSLLSHMIPPKGRIRTQKRHFKPSSSECEESIIIHAKIPGDVSRLREEKVKNMQQLGMTVQSYIIVVGITIEEITTTYVCVDTNLYNVPSVLKGIDVCFKVFHTFDANYPPESEHIWYLIQRELYKFTTENDKKISYILEIISALNNSA